MSIQLTQSSSEYLSHASGLFDEGMTGSVWFRSVVTGTARGILRAYDSGGSAEFQVNANVTFPRKINVLITDGVSTIVSAVSGTNWAANTWYCVQWMWTSGFIGVRIDNNSWTFAAHSITVNPDTLWIGRYGGGYMNGELAELAFSGSDLSIGDDETKISDAWATGYSPRSMKTWASHYWPFADENDLTDRHSQITLTANNTPTKGTNHPRLFFLGRHAKVSFPPHDVRASASITATASVLAAARRTRGVVASITATGTASATVQRATNAAASITGLASVEAVGVRVRGAEAEVEGVATATGTAVRLLGAEADVTGVATVDGTAIRVAVPEERDVREGIVYGPSGEFEGTIVLPAEADVVCGTPYGAPVTPGANIGMVPDVGNVREAVVYGEEDGLTGTLVLPHPSMVRCGVEYGAPE